MGFKKALLLFNGNKEAAELNEQLSQTLPKLAQGIEQLHVIGTRSVEHLYQVCREFASDAELLIILGGDGTVHECVNAVAGLEKRPVLGILPGGTCNDFSRMMGIPQNLDQAAEAVLSGHPVEVDIGKSADRYFLNFWGIGLVTKASLNRDEEKKKRLGVLSYFISTLKTINQADPFHYQIEADGKQMEGEAVMLIVLNGRFVGTQRIPLPSIHPADGKMDLLIIKDSNLTLFKEVLKVNEESDLSDFTELDHLQVSQLSVETEKEEEIDMDGEIYNVTPASLQVLPEHLRIIRAADSFTPEEQAAE